MQRFYVLSRCWVWVLCVLYTVPAYSSDQEERLLIQLIQEAKDYDDILPVMDIIKRKPGFIRKIPVIAPVDMKKAKITSPYGYRKDPVDGNIKFHSGVDLALPLATTVHVTADGEVSFSGRKAGYGNVIIVKHKWGFESKYAHLSVRYIGKGAIVKRGDVIGFVGNTGKSTGNHLHYEIIKNKKQIKPCF